MLVYVDDVIHIAKDSKENMMNINQVYILKEVFGPPDIYLGVNVDNV